MGSLCGKLKADLQLFHADRARADSQGRTTADLQLSRVGDKSKADSQRRTKADLQLSHAVDGWQRRILDLPAYFKCNSRQCWDLADYLEVVAISLHGREPIDRSALMELRRAMAEAVLFLEDCSREADFERTIAAFTKLHTREAYDVLLHDLIWAKATYDVALSVNDTRSQNRPIDDQHIEKCVQECTSLLSSLTSEEVTQVRLDRDRNAFKHCLQLLYKDKTQNKKCLTFLVQTQEELSRSSDSIRKGTEALLKKFEINFDDLKPEVGKDNDQWLLGSGNNGKVHRRSWLGRTVAVKELCESVTKEIFYKEASILASLRNPFIVDMVGWCEDKGRYILVMEAVHTNLEAAIKSEEDNPTLSLHDKVDIMLQISKGMEYLHRRKIIHRDVKPDNVLLELARSPVQGYARVKLCDFGIAKVKELGEEDQSLYTTMKGGTSFYRAPEVLAGSNSGGDVKYSRKADVFSFAITCAQILGGYSTTNCYEDLTSEKLREKWLQNVRPNLPACPPLKDLIERCWDTVPEKRPSFYTISRTLTYIKFILLRTTKSERRTDIDKDRYDCLVSPFDEAELTRRRAGEDSELQIQGAASVAQTSADSRLS